MAFETTRQVLDHVREIHHKLGDYYHNLSEEVDRESVAMMLTYLSQHEYQLEDYLEQYEEATKSSILDTWFKFVPEVSVFTVLNELEVRHDMTTDDVLHIVLEIDGCLKDLYKGMVRNAVMPEVKECFQSLLTLEIREEKQVVRNTAER